MFEESQDTHFWGSHGTLVYMVTFNLSVSGHTHTDTHTHTHTWIHIHTHAHTHTHTQHTTPKMCAHPHTSSPPSLTQFWGIRGKREPLCVCHRQNLSHTHSNTQNPTHMPVAGNWE